MARNPWRCRARISASKPVASAQAPWTNTIVGVSVAIVVTAPFVDGLPDAATVPRQARAARASELPLGWLPAVAERLAVGAPAPSPGGCRCAEGGTPDPCPRDHPARPGVKLEPP